MSGPRKIKVVAQRKAWDCGVAAQAMLFGRSYGDVAAILKARWPDQRPFRKRGLTLGEMVELAALVGGTLEIVWKAEGYLDGATGILTLKGERYCKMGHYVVLKDGTHVVDPDGSDVWKLEDYLVRYGVRPVTFLAWKRS